MNIPDLWAQVEMEHAWRLDEIRSFQNRIAKITAVDEQDKLRRALVLILYAHFEGFCRFAFALYVNAVNSEEITCAEANYALAAASLSDLFQALRDPSKKCKEFRRQLPDDTMLHRFARDREFLENAREFEKRLVTISDNVVEPESNLKPIVLRKILYRLGFQQDQFEELEHDIHLLLNYRNKIGHGESKEGIPPDKYKEVRNAAYKIMGKVKSEIMDSLVAKSYMRVTP